MYQLELIYPPKHYCKDLKSERTKDEKKQNRGLQIPCDEDCKSRVTKGYAIKIV